MLNFLGLLSFGDAGSEIMSAPLLERTLAPCCGGPVRVDRHGGLLLASAMVRRGGPRPPPSPIRRMDGGRLLGGEFRLIARDESAGELGLGASDVDDETLAARAWDRWGEDAPSHLYGDFTFFVLDPSRPSLTLVRDETPSRPLYYVHRPGEFLAFANHPRALTSLPFVDPSLDETSFAAAVTLTAMDAAETGYREVRRVARAGCTTATPEAVTARRWWTPTYRDSPVRRDDDEYVDDARNLFDRVVRDHYGEGGKVGILLSGGLDGMAVADSVVRQGLGPLTAYAVLAAPEHCTIRRPGMIADQRPTVDAFLRDHPELKARIIPYQATPCGDETLERLRRTGLFSVAAQPSGLLEDARRAMAEDGIVTVMGGHGGNSTLSCEGWQRLDDLRNEGRWLSLLLEAALCLRRRGLHALRPLARRAAPDWMLALWRRRLADPSLTAGGRPTRLNLLTPAVATAIRQRYGRRSCLTESRSARDEILSSLCRDHSYLDGGYQPWRTAGMSLRTPMQDRRMVDFALSLPADQFLRHGQTRRLMRRMCAGRLPPDILADERHGDDLSSLDHRGTLWRSDILKALPGLRSSPLARRIFDLDALERQVAEDWPDAATPDGYHAISHISSMAMAARFAQMVDGGNG